VIRKSKAGLSANELEGLIGMEVRRKLNSLAKKGLISVVKIGHAHYYFSDGFDRARRQLIRRYNKNKGFRVQLKGELQEIIFTKAGKVLRDRIRYVCEKNGIVITQRENDIIIASLLRPLLRAGVTDEDLKRYLKRNSELKGFFSFINTIVPCRSEINAVKQKLDHTVLNAIFVELVLWVVEQLKLEKTSIAIDGTHCHQSHGNTRGIKIHAACILEIGLPVGLVLLEDGMEYDLKSLIKLLKQIQALGLKIEFVVGDSLYDAPEFYYQVAMILDAEGISVWKKHRSLADYSPVNDTLLEFFEQRVEHREEVKTENSLRKQGILNKRGRYRKVPDAKLSLDDKKVQGELLRKYPLTPWASEKRKEIYKKRPVVERLFSILKLWLGLDGLRTKGQSRMWSVFASFISLLVLSIIVVVTGLPDMLIKVRKFVI
jgi:hypothetical protein